VSLYSLSATTYSDTGLVAHLFAARAANADKFKGQSASQIESAASML
jgi:hypothetical protein